MAFFLATMMFSLAGVPPLAGFFAKFYVFAAAIKAGLYGLSVIGVLASAVGAYYYLRIVKLMYFDEPAAAFDRRGDRRPQRARAGGAPDPRVHVRPVAPDQRRDGGGANAVLTAAPRGGPRRPSGGSIASSTIDSTNEEARRRAARRRSRALCGSSPPSRRPAEAGAAAAGCRPRAISTRARS